MAKMESSHSPKRRKVSSTGDTLSSRNATALATASPFVLQTEELLKEVKVDYSTAFKDADALLKQLKDVIEGIPSLDPVPISDATQKFQKKHQIKIPYPDPRPAADAPYKLACAKPISFNVVGSYVSKTMTKAQPLKAIDMIVQMPQSLFQEKDFQNMRYFYRRAYYIANIAAGVRSKMGSSVQLEFDNLNENNLLPILSIRPTGAEVDSETNSANGDDDKQPVDYTIRVIPCAPEGLFPKSKLLPSTNSVKLGQADMPTPFYNSTIKAEEIFVTYLRVLARARNQCAAFSDACILGRVWLQQRGLGGSISKGGFGHFEWAIIMALLLQKGGRNGQPALSSALSSTELFKATIQFLASTDFVKEPFVFGTYPRGSDAIREQGPVMFDVDRELNVLYKMSPWSASLLQYHASSTLELLSSSFSDPFEATFITKTDVVLQLFDAVIHVDDIDLERNAAASDRRGPVWNFSLKAYTTLQRALSDRASLIHIQTPSYSPWLITSVHPSDAVHILIGVVFNPANMGRAMEYGPSAEARKEAAKFRQFWGDKSELRRFKDGSILECVAWNDKSAAGICEEIVRYTLKLHLDVSPDTLRFQGSQIPAGLDFTPVDKDAFDMARRAFQTLEHDIRSLEGMPLSVRRLAPVVSELRYASVKAPAIGFHTEVVPPMDVHLSFEASSRWPENIVAIQEAKIDFLLDIDRRLRAANDSITTVLGRDNALKESDNLAYLDVVYDNGAAFRLRIHADLEDTLLDRQVKNKTLDPYIRAEAEDALFSLNWYHKLLPLHTQSVASLCTRIAPLSPTIRMVKHWFNAHKLANHISEELIELLVLHVFLQPEPWKIPSSAQTGFLRTLFFLSRWDWRADPLVVDFSDELSHDDHNAVRRHLEAWRVRDPNMNRAVLFVSTNHDTEGLSYTRGGPSKLAATRMTRLAKAASRLVRDRGVDLDMDELFEPSLRDYDVLFHVSSSQVRRVLRNVMVASSSGAVRHSIFKNLDERTGSVPTPAARHPLDVLFAELELVYQDSLIFFRGGQGDATVGAIWQPKLRTQEFRVGLPFNFHKVDGEGAQDGEAESDAVEINKEAVLLEIARIGGELIKRIEVSSR
ncbi:pre-rRNA processing protein Utp22 [Sodiomyces alkalinus F11]|uniref:U3 small nucleolar RNA-associated protein 22 n=1 Tax=Sodiomyces alkalinus (strain CBS 110278 / VKM F-3762 / F11) TaxID=1314773 RepID=A0A3N2Q7S5_SODAK|nr:pre-rRNA processing protein Utp22 [Sodiomyces alkalinus F11]ROT42737.1 pre-rRNA processing protein Utp22 [Sodiomyces alkalinus F11]